MSGICAAHSYIGVIIWIGGARQGGQLKDVSYRDYKKFRSDTKIVPMTEAEPH